MKKISLRKDENLFIMSYRETEELKAGLIILFKHLDAAYLASGEKSMDKALADRLELIKDKL